MVSQCGATQSATGLIFAHHQRDQIVLSAKCIHCQEAIEVPDSLIGDVETCPSCGKQFTVPGPTVAKAPLPEEPSSGRRWALYAGAVVVAAGLATAGWMLLRGTARPANSVPLAAQSATPPGKPPSPAIGVSAASGPSAAATEAPAAAVPPATTIDAKPVQLRLKEPALDFAFSSQSGCLLALDSLNSAVTLYSKDFLKGQPGASPIKVKVGTMPMAIIAKCFKGKAYFVVGCESDGNLYVIDAISGQVKTVPTVGTCVRAMTDTGNCDDPLVYYLSQGRLCRANIETFSDAGAMDRLENLYAERIAMSPDGRYLYAKSGGASDRVEVLVRTAIGNGETFVPDPVVGNCGRIAVDPRGIYLFIGDRRHSFDGRRRMTEETCPAECFVPNRPLMAALETREIVGYSYNSLKQTGRYSWPEEFNKQVKPLEITTSEGGGRSLAFQRRLFCDPENDRLVLAFHDQVLLLPVSLLNPPADPVLAIGIPSFHEMIAGQDNRMALDILDKRVKVELKRGPKGMTLEASSLRWTPQADQAGAHEVAIRSFASNTELITSVSVNVRRPQLLLSFEPEILSLSSDGQWAVVASGTQIRYRPPDPQAAPTPISEPKLAVIDLESMIVLCEKAISEPLTMAAIDSQNVYTSVMNAGFVDVLNRQDLSPRQKLPVAQLASVVPINSKWLVVGGDAVQFFSLPGLSPASDPPWRTWPFKPQEFARNATFRHELRPGALPRRVGDGWECEGVIFNSDMSKVRQVLSRRPEDANHLLWNRSTGHWGLADADGRRLADAPGNVMCILEDLPAIAAAKCTDSQVLQLQLFDLNNASMVKAFDLDEGVRSEHGVQLATAGRAIYCLSGHSLYRVKVSDDTAKKLPMPFAFQPPRSVPVVRDAQATLEHKLMGGRGPYEFVLERGGSGITVDKTTGAIIIQSPVLQAKVIEEVVAMLQQADSQEAAEQFVGGFEANAARQRAVLNPLLDTPVAGAPGHQSDRTVGHPPATIPATRTSESDLQPQVKSSTESAVEYVLWHLPASDRGKRKCRGKRTDELFVQCR